MVDRFGGSISAEHGIGVVKRDSAPGRSRKAGAARWAEFQIAKPLPAPCSAVLLRIWGRARVRSRSPVQSSSSKCSFTSGARKSIARRSVQLWNKRRPQIANDGIMSPATFRADLLDQLPDRRFDKIVMFC